MKITQEQFEAFKKAEGYSYTREALNLVEELMNDELTEDVVNEAVIEHFVYYVDALNYLNAAQQWNFEEAINNAWARNAAEIAVYYLSEEVNAIINELEAYFSVEETELTLNEKIKAAAEDIAKKIVDQGDPELLEALRKFH